MSRSPMADAAAAVTASSEEGREGRAPLGASADALCFFFFFECARSCPSSLLFAAAGRGRTRVQGRVREGCALEDRREREEERADARPLPLFFGLSLRSPPPALAHTLRFFLHVFPAALRLLAPVDARHAGPPCTRLPEAHPQLNPGRLRRQPIEVRASTAALSSFVGRKNKVRRPPALKKHTRSSAAPRPALSLPSTP